METGRMIRNAPKDVSNSENLELLATRDMIRVECTAAMDKESVPGALLSAVQHVTPNLMFAIL